jgi:hypothetical protein
MQQPTQSSTPQPQQTQVKRKPHSQQTTTNVKVSK